MRRFYFILALAFLAAAAMSPASAQTPDRHGFYASVGGGYGSFGLKGDQGDNIDGISSDLKKGFTGYLAFGGTLSPTFRLGFETDGFWSTADVSGTTYDLHSLMYSAVLTFYVQTATNLHGKLYLGYVENTLNQDIGNEGGFAMGLGAGYDWVIGKGGLVLEPFVNYLAQVTGAKFSSDVSSNPEKFKSTLLQVGIGIGYNH